MLAGGAAVPAEPAAAVRDALRPGPHQGQHHPVPRRGLRSHHPLEPQQVLSSTSHTHRTTPPTHPPPGGAAHQGLSPTVLGKFQTGPGGTLLVNRWDVPAEMQGGFGIFFILPCSPMRWTVIVNTPRNEAARQQRLDLLSTGPVEIIIPRVESALTSQERRLRSLRARRIDPTLLISSSTFGCTLAVCSEKKHKTNNTTANTKLFFGFPITERFILVLSGDEKLKLN